ncbi:MAG: CBS domain-containing protein [Dethiobacter sp.]|nr:CBS domain-containing protein [Dethiobacter sp.]MBS3901974.1 CBS domain-containing protein [Dethiobacter sp.]MBS3988958.1 CBS domain-containing protein [Dethiobacter sp.]
MLAKEIMITDLPLVTASASLAQLAQAMVSNNSSHVLVVAAENKLLGLVSGMDLRTALAEGNLNFSAEQIMTPRHKLLVASPDTPLEAAAEILAGRKISQLPVVLDDVPVGYLHLNTVLEMTSQSAKKSRNQLEQFRQAALLVEAMREGLAVVDRDYRLREFNPAAVEYSGLAAEQVLGQRSRLYQEDHSPVRRVMETGKPLLNLEVRTSRERVFMTNNVPIVVDGEIVGVMQTFSDITDLKRLQQQLLHTKEELDKAFALTLPNSRVEYKLKGTPEYRDVFNAANGLIEVTEVIEDGGYQHVVNALKVTADLNEKGLMGLLGIDKDILVQALIFHDLGKSQPVLNVGQVADPRKVFEPGIIHAMRSADIAENYYQKPKDVVTLIRYHHHSAEQLPADFPSHLLPMLRLLQIIDGLSAGLTRRNGRIGFRVNGSRVTIVENNAHPAYNRTIEVDLYTGQDFVYNGIKLLNSKREAATK